MTDHADPIRDAMTRLLAATPNADETRKALEGIKSRRLPPRNRNHSVRHKSCQRGRR